MKEFTCIICPNGCHLTVDDNLNVSGNSCKRGLEFALQEIKDPKRSLTTTIKTKFKEVPVVSVKSNAAIKKDLILKCMDVINRSIINEKHKIGDTIIKNILDTGVDIILTSNKLEEIK